MDQLRLAKWTTQEGKVLERWTIDVKVTLPGRAPADPRLPAVKTRRRRRAVRAPGAGRLLAGTLRKEVKEVPTLEAFQARFLDNSEVNNKPSTVYSKRWVLREHLVPAFGRRRLDTIRPADVEAYKAAKLRAGRVAPVRPFGCGPRHHQGSGASTSRGCPASEDEASRSRGRRERLCSFGVYMAHALDCRTHDS